MIEAALEAARIRLRPILMTSFAFIFGVLPLAISTSAGANSRVAIGTAVIGGMLTATILAIFYIPLFFVLIRRGTRDVLKHFHHDKPDETTAEAIRSARPQCVEPPGGNRMIRKILLGVSLAVVSACSMAPKYVQPELPVPPELADRRRLPSAKAKRRCPASPTATSSATRGCRRSSRRRWSTIAICASRRRTSNPPARNIASSAPSSSPKSAPPRTISGGTMGRAA